MPQSRQRLHEQLRGLFRVKPEQPVDKSVGKPKDTGFKYMKMVQSYTSNSLKNKNFIFNSQFYYGLLECRQYCGKYLMQAYSYSAGPPDRLP